MNPSRFRYGALVLLPLAIATLLGARAVADEASDRESYLRDIETKLDSAIGELSGVESDSDDGDIRDAEGHIAQVRDLVSRLDSVKGDHPRAREVVDRYPRYISDFGSAAQHLKMLKSKQRSAEELVRQCKVFDTAMTERARAAKDDPRGADELSDLRGCRPLGEQASGPVGRGHRPRRPNQGACRRTGQPETRAQEWPQGDHRRR
jgi:hypothetical protein